MPLHIGSQAYYYGFDSVPFLWPAIKALPWLGALYLLKVYFSGASNTSERNMHGKVVMVTVRQKPRLQHYYLPLTFYRAAQAA